MFFCCRDIIRYFNRAGIYIQTFRITALFTGELNENSLHPFESVLTDQGLEFQFLLRNTHWVSWLLAVGFMSLNQNLYLWSKEKKQLAEASENEVYFIQIFFTDTMPMFLQKEGKEISLKISNLKKNETKYRLSYWYLLSLPSMRILSLPKDDSFQQALGKILVPTLVSSHTAWGSPHISHWTLPVRWISEHASMARAGSYLGLPAPLRGGELFLSRELNSCSMSSSTPKVAAFYLWVEPGLKDCFYV